MFHRKRQHTRDLHRGVCHVCPLNSPHPKLKVMWTFSHQALLIPSGPAHTTRPCSYHQALLIPPGPAHTTRSCSYHQVLLIPPGPAHTTRPCSSYKSYDIPTARYLAHHWEYASDYKPIISDRRNGSGWFDVTYGTRLCTYWRS